MTRKEICKRIEVIQDRYAFDGKIPRHSDDEKFLIELFRHYPELPYLKNGLRFKSIEVQKGPRGTSFFLTREDAEKKRVAWRECLNKRVHEFDRPIEKVEVNDAHRARYEQLSLIQERQNGKEL